ncbi:hypothetical protein CcaverHIS631_0301460 [Cutaneotrichosporon cavernicola]|nr:hypothetical protein CcaverHIS631_0301460 [Cutaneotrichosporon cavernicola]BEJ05624.1 hypothetical protein CcaverHIS641_0301460 [Cutaneotrichosporon cavernicola]
MDDDPNLFVWRSYLPAELCDSQSGPTPQSQFPAYLPPPAFQVSNTLASTGTQYPTHGLLASPAGGQTGLPSQRTPKNATTNRVPKSSLKQNGASSRSRPPSRSGNYLEEIAKARSLRKAKSQTFHRSGGQDRIRNDLINFAKSLSLEQYDRMGFGHDFHTAFWNAFIQQNVYAAPLQESQHILHTHKTALEKASLRFAGGYQISKQKDEKMRTAFEKFLNTYPWGDRVVRKSDVQVAFEKSPEGLPFQVLPKRTPTGGISPYWTHFFKRFAYRWVDAHPRLLHTDTLENVEKTPRRRRTSATPRPVGRQASLPPVEHLNLGTTTAKHVQTTITGQSIVTKDGTLYMSQQNATHQHSALRTEVHQDQGGYRYQAAGSTACGPAHYPAGMPMGVVAGSAPPMPSGSTSRTPSPEDLPMPPGWDSPMVPPVALPVEPTLDDLTLNWKDLTSEQIAAQLEALCGLAPPQQTHPLPVSGSFTDYPLPRPEQEATTSHTLYHQAVPVPLPQGNHAVYDNSQIASFHNPDVSFTHLPASGSLPKEFGSSLVTQQSNTNIGPLVFHNGYWCQVGQPVYVHAPIEQPRPVIQNFIDPTKLHVGFRPAQHHEEEGSGSGSSSEDYRSFF